MKARRFDVTDWSLIAGLVANYAAALWLSRPDSCTSDVNLAIGATATVAGLALLTVDLRRRRRSFKRPRAG